MVLCLVSVSDCVMCTGPLDVMLSVMYVDQVANQRGYAGTRMFGFSQQYG